MISIDRWNTVKVNEYKGEYSVVAGFIDKEGNEGVQVCKRMFGKDEKKTPVSVKIGTRDTAADNLRAIYNEIYGEDSECPF
jgi:hypothetical protein